MLFRFALVWKRAAPYTPLRSVRAIAGMSSSQARLTSISGSDAPSRKLKALAACSSTYCSVIERDHLIDVLAYVTHKAAAQERSVLGTRNQIPMLKLPEHRVPPLTTCRPRA